MAGIILLNGIKYRAFFDIGASYSFISRSFATTHGIDIVDTEHTIWVQIPEHAFCAKNVCCVSPVRIGDWIMPANLLVLNRMVRLT